MKHQVITGWEATAQAGEHVSPAFEKYNDELFDRAVNELGITRLRLELFAGVENPTDYYTLSKQGKVSKEEYRDKQYIIVNDNDDPNSIAEEGFQFAHFDLTVEKVVIPLKKRLQAKGSDLYINLNYVAFGSQKGKFRYLDNPQEYAEFILAAFLHMDRKFGFVPDAVQVILEPDNKVGWTGDHIARAIELTSDKLKAAGFEPGFIAPNTTNAENAPKYIDEIARSKKAMSAITEFGYHRYCCAKPKVLRDIASSGEAHGKTTSMLEYIGADYTMLHDDLKLARVSAWQQYTIAFPIERDNGAQYYLVDDTNPHSPVLKMGERTRFLRLYFLHARPGAQVIGAETSNAAFDPIAFANEDGSTSIVIKADAPGTIAIKNPGTGEWSYSFATHRHGDGNGKAKRNASGDLEVTIPGSGVVAVYNQSAKGVQQ
ncbi:MAG: hypothetical protein DWQ47_01890 [Acidobacteria bacterium]|nr:MAG: hypothetical protein DWQ32_05440 [Acidobacteriota bacterium]REK01175.1 MAG: hypothetical protein DWQ38_01875 [Acidobacteriota bacterium]REK14131.1 MAG: hypothetical protein DWQ43_11130 [Acidobacteriota bacterium]REK44846.1 MAG: hypothetical protein DWQ47_01890 [Acidobacteriota bacterium]